MARNVGKDLLECGIKHVLRINASGRANAKKILGLSIFSVPDIPNNADRTADLRPASE
jgi:hypothetical protein